MKKRILITGAGGFIGGFLVEKALASGFETWAGVRRSTSRAYLKDSAIRFIDLSFQDPQKLTEELTLQKEQFGRWDVIIHNLGVTKCLNPDDFDRINHQYVRNFAEALRGVGMVPDQFILMSSLGASGPGDETGMTPISRDDTPTPNTAYGKSKLKAENCLRELPGFPYVFIRPTGVYGPREKDYLLMLRTIRAGFDFGAGFKPQRITFIYVRDLVDCIFRVIEKKITRRTYVVSEPADYSASDFRRIAQQELHKRRIIPVTVPLFILYGIAWLSEKLSAFTGKPATLNCDKYHIMKQRNWICDITPLQEELDFTPSYSLQRGLRETIHWYKEQGWL